MTPDHAVKRGAGTLGVVARRRRVYDAVVEQRSLLVEGHHLAARAVSGVDGEHTAAAQGRREQELAQIVGEYVDGDAVCLLLERRRDLGLDRRPYEPVRGVLDGIGYQVSAFPVGLAGHIGVDQSLVEVLARIVEHIFHFEEALLLGAAQRQVLMGGHAAHRLREVGVKRERRCLYLGLLVLGRHADDAGVATI